jgi:hypothetical protein
MFFLHLREYEDVINEYYNKFIQILNKHLIHEIYEIGWGICQSKDITVYSYNPYRVRNAVFRISDSRIFS